MQRSHSLVVAAALALTGTAALAQSGPEVIDIAGKVLAPVRNDVSALCPRIAVELPDELAAAARERGEAALVDVRFTLEGTRVSAVSSSGGPAVYRRAIRRALLGQQCRSDDATRQAVALRVAFVDPDARSGESMRVALRPRGEAGATHR